MELVEIRKEITTKLADKSVAAALLATTFKGLTEPTMKRAIMEGMIRGFQFKDFLEKNVYAIPYGDTYSLVTSIDNARKIGMRSGIVGKSAPTFDQTDEKIISCTITVKRKVAEYVGDFTATVFWDEYSTGRNLWKTKPRTMLAKVAEMHALRMACPEEMSSAFIEEEKELELTHIDAEVVDVETYEARLRETTTLEGLRNAWAKVPKEFHKQLMPIKDELKVSLTPLV